MTGSLLDAEGPKPYREKPYGGPRQATKASVASTYPVFEQQPEKGPNGEQTEKYTGRLQKAMADRGLKKGEKYIVATAKTLWKDTLFQIGQRAILGEGDAVPGNFIVE